MRIEEQEYLDFNDVLLKPKRSKLSSRRDTNLHREFNFPHSTRVWDGIPIIAANMDTVATLGAAKVFISNKMGVALHKHYSEIDLVDFFNDADSMKYGFYTIGISSYDEIALNNLRNKLGFFPNICIDVANGYSEYFVEFCKRIRLLVGNEPIIMAGNICTSEMAEELVLSGIDIVKAGIGGGSACTTRKVAGVGVPQFSCIVETADAVHGLGGTLCSDGGIIDPADLMKAYGAGADFVMIGGAFAGHDESGGEEVYDDGVIIGKQFYGMSSNTAMDKYNNGVASYRSSEGRTAIVPYRGPLQSTIEYFLGGVRSGMTYIGAKNIKEISKRATFIRVRKTINSVYESATTHIR